MECIDVTSMSSRGQVVIPQKLRDKLGLSEGEKFIIMGEEGTLILKRIKKPSKEELIKELDRIAKNGRERAEKLGIKEKDIPGIIHRFRGVKE